MRLISIIIALACTVFSQVVPGAPPKKPEIPKTCRVEGMVVAADDSRPIAKAIVMFMNAGPGAESQRAITDADGRFVTEKLACAPYLLMAQHNGYAAQHFGSARPGRVGAPLALTPGQHVKDIVFRLVREGIIAGRVMDDTGEPLRRGLVIAAQLARARGKRTIAPVAFALTDDKGEYRVYDIPAGRYYIMVTDALSKVLAPGMLMMSMGGGAAGAAIGEDLFEEMQAAPTFYPGTNYLREAQTLEVRAGEEQRADLPITRTMAVTVSGKVVSASGEPVNGFVRLSNTDALLELPMFGNSMGPIDDDGTFTIKNVLPGSYTLIARGYAKAALQRAREGARPQVPEPGVAVMPLDVGSTPMTGVTVTLAGGAAISGIVTFEGLPAGSKPPRANVSLMPRDVGSDFGDVFVFAMTSENSPTFNFTGVQRLVYRVDATAVGGEGENEESPFYLKSIRYGGEDVLQNGFDGRNVSPGTRLEVVFARGAGGIDGVALDGEGKPLMGARVYLVPDSARRKQTRLHRFTIADQRGSFKFDAIPPGEYKVFSLLGDDDDELSDTPHLEAEVLAKIESSGQAVTVSANQRASAQVKTIPAPEGKE